MFQKQKRYSIIEDWFKEDYFTNKNTIGNYRSGVRKFLVVFLKIPNPNDYPNMKRDFGKDVMNFCMYVKNRSPKSYKLLLSAIKGFFEYYDLPFPTKKEKKFRKRNIGKIKKVREEKLLTSIEIRKLLSHGSIKEKSFYLVMLSGGLRPMETRSILLTDMDMEYQPNDEITLTKIHIRKPISKNKTPRDTFINEETTQYLKEWLKEREEWLRKSQRTIFNSADKKEREEMIATSTEIIQYKSPRKGSEIKEYPIWNDNRVFPFGESVQSREFHKMLKKAKFVKRTNTPKRQYYEVLPKMFRTYFKTTLENEVGVARVERLLGHEGYLTESYRGVSKETLQDLAIKYYENQNILNIFSSKYTDKELKSTKKELEYSKKWTKELIEEERKKRGDMEKTHNEEIQKLYGHINNLMKKVGEIRQLEDEEDEKTELLNKWRKEEEAMSPEEIEKQRKIDKKNYEIEKESERKEREKEEAKTPEQKAEEKMKKDKQLKKLKEQ